MLCKAVCYPSILTKTIKDLVGVKFPLCSSLMSVETVCIANVNVNVNDLHLENSENELQHVSELTFLFILVKY